MKKNIIEVRGWGCLVMLAFFAMAFAFGFVLGSL